MHMLWLLDHNPCSKAKAIALTGHSPRFRAFCETEMFYDRAQILNSWHGIVLFAMNMQLSFFLQLAQANVARHEVLGLFFGM